MSRPLRVEFPGALYLVTARAAARQRLFREDGERQDFLARLPELTGAYGAVFHGFCVLPDHYHLLVETPNGNLSQVIHRLNAGYTAALNARRRRRGSLLQSRYRALLLDEDWLVPLSIHVHLNPVRKRLTPDPWSYAGSSAAGYGRAEVLVPGLNTDRVLGLAGGRKAYAESLDSALLNRPPAPWKQVWRQVVLGGEELRQRVMYAVRDRDVREVPGFSPRPSGSSLSRVLTVVSESTGLDPSQLTTGKYQRVLARKVAIYLARRFTSCTLKEIGDAFGVDYTTVHMAVRRVDERRAEDSPLDDLLTVLEEELGREQDGRRAVSEQQERIAAPLSSPQPQDVALPEEEGDEGSPAAKNRARGRRRGKEGGQLDLF